MRLRKRQKRNPNNPAWWSHRRRPAMPVPVVHRTAWVYDDAQGRSHHICECGNEFVGNGRCSVGRLGDLSEKDT